MLNQYYSPVNNREFVWFAEYNDGTNLAEFDFKTKKENNFYDIDKNKLINFSLIGHGYKFNFDVLGGFFNLGNNRIGFVYKTKDKVYNLNLTYKLYNDIIQYKSCYSDFDPLGQHTPCVSKIYQYNFGYKNKFIINGVNFNFKVICHIPFDKPVYMSIYLVASEDLNGKLQIYNNGRIVDEFDAPLKKNISGSLNWVVK